MRSADDYHGERVLIIDGKYKGKKGHITYASEFGIYVDLDYKPLRVKVQISDVIIIKC